VNIQIVDANILDMCVYPKPHRPAPTLRVVGPIEQGWINYQPHFPAPVKDHEKPSIATMKALPEHPLTDAINRLEARAEALDFIIGTPCCKYHADESKAPHSPDHHGTPLELETVTKELRRNGIPSSSLDSTPYDDENGPSLADAIGPNDPVPYIQPDPALIRRIEWERGQGTQSDQSIRFMLVKKDGVIQTIATRDKVADGKPVLALTPRDVPPALVREADAKIAAALAENKRRFADVMAAREHATFINGIGSKLYGVVTGYHPPFTATSPIIEARVPDENEGGPKELGFHFETENAKSENHLYDEPSELQLWQLSVEELATTIRRGLRLNKIEEEWLEANPEAQTELQSLSLSPISTR
jgi:hypothetical protein